MESAPPPAVPPADAKRVLVTGAAGRIGRYFAAQNAGRYRLRLMVLPGDKHADALRPLGEVVEANLTDLDAMRRVTHGIDACVHLAGDPRPNGTWDNLLQANIIGTYHLFVAALAAGCKRVVYASSIHAVSGYPADVQVKPTDAVNPGDLYGVTKCFGEALARYVAEQEGMSVVAIRIGGVTTPERVAGDTGLELMDAWVSPRDLDQLIVKALDGDQVKFAIVHGLSDNRFKRLDITNARELFGYAPQDDTTTANAQLRPLDLPVRVLGHNLGDADDPRKHSGLRDELHHP